MQENFSEVVSQNAEKIIGLLKNAPAANSWDIKLKLKLSSSNLYLALGYLISANKITIFPDDLNYKIKLNQE
ncbi:MAG: hypothetical protein COT17_05360 [Elusimicrobia bacterium CG08_land_8_20_14_0_20_51_18]|nr:MAG: hypothetical protein COT17_05360 [Elusimicrobia bacterium CG08_land_8_20_14_0_20_51_18]